jgi:hypothetical protein
MDRQSLWAGLGRDQEPAEQLPGCGSGFFGRLHQTHSAPFPPAAGIDLRLEGTAASETRGQLSGLFGASGHIPWRNRDPITAEKLLGLIFVNIHAVLIAAASG